MIVIAINYIGGSFNTVCPHFLNYEAGRTVKDVRYLADLALGRPTCFGWGEVCFRKNNLSPVLSGREEGVYPPNRNIHQNNCQTIVCFFLLISSEYCCWTRPGEEEVPGLHFFFPPLPATQYRCRI